MEGCERVRSLEMWKGWEIYMGERRDGDKHTKGIRKSFSVEFQLVSTLV
jgi:hypothetical protein